jgi:hypothetical protein
MPTMLRNISAITSSYKTRARKKLPFGELMTNFQWGLVDFAASEEESKISNERQA